MGREDRMLKYTDIQKVNAEISGIEVKGKNYAMVNSRIDAFRKICPNGSISTDIIALENGVVTMKATVCDEDGKVLGTGFAQEKETSSYINKTSFIENCETSAVGRALGMCGIGVADSIASAEELVNAISNQSTKRKTTNKAENKPKEKVSAESGNSGWQRQKSAENGSEDDDIKKAKHEFVQRCNENGQSAVEIMESAGWSIDKGDATLDDYAKANIILDERLGAQS